MPAAPTTTDNGEVSTTTKSKTCLNDDYEAVANAKSSLDNANDIESELIKALDTRYPKEASVEDFGPWNDAFADVMRQVYQNIQTTWISVPYLLKL
jgi:hypothetical protein